MAEIILAGYKGKGNIFDKTIRGYTASIYSHTEIIYKGDMFSSTSYVNDSGSTGVRFTKHWDDNNKWDYYRLPTQREFDVELAKSLEGAGYDWTGIFLSQLIPIGCHEGQKWFCSEVDAQMIKQAGTKIPMMDPHEYSPRDLIDFAILAGATKFIK